MGRSPPKIKNAHCHQGDTSEDVPLRAIVEVPRPAGRRRCGASRLRAVLSVPGFWTRPSDGQTFRPAVLSRYLLRGSFSVIGLGCLLAKTALWFRPGFAK